MSSPIVHEHFKMTVMNGSSALGAHLRVRIDSSGLLELADAAENAIGFLTDRGAAANEPATVISITAPEYVVVVNEANAIGAIIYADAAGECADTDAGSAKVIGLARDAATADGDLVRVYRTDV